MRFLIQCKNFIAQVYRLFVPYINADYSSGTYNGRYTQQLYLESTSEISMSISDAITSSDYRTDYFWEEDSNWENREEGLFSYYGNQRINGLKYVHKGLLNAKLSVHYWQEHYSDTSEDSGFVRLGGLPFADRGWHTYDQELSHGSEIQITDGSTWTNSGSDPLSVRTYIDIYQSLIQHSHLSCGIDAIMLDFYDVSQNGFRF